MPFSILQYKKCLLLYTLIAMSVYIFLLIWKRAEWSFFERVLMMAAQTEYLMSNRKTVAVKYLLPEKNQSYVRKNIDTKPKSQQIAILTLLTNLNYLPAAQILSFSIFSTTKSLKNVDFIALVMEEVNLTDIATIGLAAAKWKVFKVPRIPPPKSVRNQYKDQFTKLWIWNLTQYSRVIYVDSDFLFLKSMEHLLSVPCSPSSICAVRDWKLVGKYPKGQFVNTFNAGLMVISPSRTEFSRLMMVSKGQKSTARWMNLAHKAVRKLTELHRPYTRVLSVTRPIPSIIKLKENNSIVFDTEKSEQAWLNEVYKSHWTPLRAEYNVVQAIYIHDRPLWRIIYPTIIGFHLTNEKHFLFQFASWNFECPMTLVYWAWQMAIVAAWGNPLTLVTTCKSEKALKLIGSMNVPAVVIFCNKNHQKQRNQHNQGIVIEHPDDLSALERLKHVSDSNPFLSVLFFWVESEEDVNIIVEAVKNLQDLYFPQIVFWHKRAPPLSFLQGYWSRAFGGSRFGIEQEMWSAKKNPHVRT